MRTTLSYYALIIRSCIGIASQSIEPWLQTKNHDLEHGEIQQTKEDRKKLDGMYEVSALTHSKLLMAEPDTFTFYECYATNVSWFY